MLDVSNDKGRGSSDGNIKDITYTQLSGSMTCDWTDDTTDKGNKTYTLRIPLGTTANGVKDQNGYISYRITIANMNEPATSTQQIIKINIDSKAPTVYSKNGQYLNASDEVRLRANPPSNMDDAKDDTIIGNAASEAKIVNSNGYFTIGDVLKEDGSELSFVALSFVRPRTSNKSKVYYPIDKPTDATGTFSEIEGSRTSGSVYINEDGLPALYLEGVTRSADNSITAPQIANNKQIHRGSLVKISGEYHLVESVSGSTATFKNPVATSVTTAEFIYAQVIDNVTAEDWTDNTLSNDDGDKMYEKIRVQGTNYQWTAMFDSLNIPDGPVTINMIAVDKAGNLTKGSVSTEIQNNRPRIAKVLLGTDLNGNGTFDYDASGDLTTDNTKDDYLPYTSSIMINGGSFGEFNYYSTLSNEAKTLGEPVDNAVVDTFIKDKQGNVTAKFKVLNEICILPEFVGGNNGIGYIMKTNATESASDVADLSTGTVTSLTDKTSLKLNNIGSEPIAKQLSEFGGVLLNVKNEKLQNYIALTFWDKTEELTQGTNSQKAFLKLHVNILANEKNKPTAKITPFYWKSKDDNSVYIDETNGTLQGHIEFEKDLTFTGSQFTGTSGEYDRDPKVSGKIKIEGELRDDVRLGTLKWNVDNFDIMEIDFATYEGGVWTYPDNYDPDTGIYDAGGDIASAMAGGLVWYKVEDVSITQAGHRAKYTIVLNTEKVTGVAKADCAVTVTANDWQSNTNLSSTTQTSATYDASGNILTDSRTPFYRMDVVPYITGIETPNSYASGINSDRIRSASGKYSVIKGNTSNAIEISGWNFSSSAITNLIHGSSTLELSKNIANAHKIVVSNNILNSGYVEVTVNNMVSLNNKNNNDSKGLYKDKPNKVTNLQNMPNRECDAITTKNITLTDDRYLRVFDMKDTGTKNGYYPTMIMEGNDPVFGFLDLNGCKDGTVIFHKDEFAPQRGKYNGSNGSKISREYLSGGARWDQMVMAKDEGGRYYQISINNETSGGMDLFYHKYASLHTVNAKYSSSYPYYTSTTYSNFAWETATGWSDFSNQIEYNKGWGYNTGNNDLSMDNITTSAGTLIDRYKYPKIITRGNSTTSTGASIYIAFYDDLTRNIFLRQFKIAASGLSYPLESGYGYTNYLENTSRSDSNSALSRILAASYASKHFAMGVTSYDSKGGYIVIAYYDESAGRLKLVHSSGKVAGNAPTGSITFNETAVTLPQNVGQYVSMDVDGSGGIHIAAFNAKDGDLSYIYLTSCTATSYTHLTVDVAESVGNWTQIKIKNNKPYIAYYNATATGQKDSIKLAYANNTIGSIKAGVEVDSNGFASTGYTTGNWEYMTVPALTAPSGGNEKFQNVCLDFDTSGTPVVGYLGTNLEFGKWLGE